MDDDMVAECQKEGCDWLAVGPEAFADGWDHVQETHHRICVYTTI